MVHLKASINGHENHLPLKRMSVFEQHIRSTDAQEIAAFGEEEVTWHFGDFKSLTVLQGVNIWDTFIKWQDFKADLIHTNQHRD